MTEEATVAINELAYALQNLLGGDDPGEVALVQVDPEDHTPLRRSEVMGISNAGWGIQGSALILRLADGRKFGLVCDKRTGALPPV